MQYLIPVDRDVVHPAVTLGDAVEDWLYSLGVEDWRTSKGGLLGGIAFASATEGKLEGTGETIREIKLVASARKVLAPNVVWRAGNLLIEALFYGKLVAYVQDPDSKAYGQLPRDYWQEVDLEKRMGDAVEEVSKESPRVPDRLIGQRILLQRECLEAWTKAQGQRLIECLEGIVSPPTTQATKRDGARWQQQTVTPRQEDIFKFFSISMQHMPDGSNPKTQSELLKIYQGWHARSGRSEAYSRTGFEKMLDRFRDGWRIAGKKWDSPQ